MTDAAPTPDDLDQDGVSGRILVFRLFLFVAIAIAAALLWFAQMAPVEVRPRIYATLAADLMAPIIGWYIIKHMPRNRHMRS